MSQIPPVTGHVALTPHRGTLILVLGILGIVIACLPFGIFAWVMGNGDLRRIKVGEMDPDGKGMTTAGMICGIVGTVLFALNIVYWVFIVLIFGGALAAGAAGAGGGGLLPGLLPT